MYYQKCKFQYSKFKYSIQKNHFSSQNNIQWNNRLSHIEKEMDTIIPEINRIRLIGNTKDLLRLTNYRTRLCDEYQQIQTEKLNKMFSNADSLHEFIRHTSISKNRQIFHCTTLPSVLSILNQGIKTNVERIFPAPSLGYGLYTSLDEPAYLCDDLPYAIVMETTKEYFGASIKPIEHYLKTQISATDVIRQYQLLAQKYAYLRHEGLYPANTELVIFQTRQSLRIVKLIIELPTKAPYIIDVTSFCMQNKIILHHLWQ